MDCLMNTKTENINLTRKYIILQQVQIKASSLFTVFTKGQSACHWSFLT